MKKRIFLLGIMLCSMISVFGQSVVFVTPKGEKMINISGEDFPISLSDADMSATILPNRKIKTNKNGRVNISSIPQIFSFNNKEKKIEIPSQVIIGKTVYTVTTIGKYVFAGYSNVKHVKIADTVETIEESAFEGNIMNSIELPSSLNYIGDYAFYSTNLKTLNLPQSLSYIGDHAFYKSKLESIVITNPIESIGENAFGHCSNLTEAVLANPEMLKDNMFEGSKKVVVKFTSYKNEGVQITRKPKNKKVDKAKEAAAPATVTTPVYATSSDVDVNIPQSNTSNENTFAVIIANEDYIKESNVECALQDGRAFHKYCERTLGIPNSNIHYVEDATLGNMMEEIKWVSNVAKVYQEDARIIIYYAGHGIPDESNGAAYLLPVDVAGNNTDGAYKLSSLYNTLGSLNAQNITVFIDACFSGSQRGAGMLASARGVAIKAKEEAPLGKMIVFSAAKDDETAYPYAEKGHGLFTYFLLKKLQETKGNVDYGTLGDYINKEVSRKSIVVNNKPQTPTVTASPVLGEKWRGLTLK